MNQNTNNYFSDLIEILVKLWHNKLFIIKCCCVGAVLSLVIGFSKPKVYQAKVCFAPETQQVMGSGVSSIASMMGVNLDNSVDALRIEMFPDIISSTPFVYDLLFMEVTNVKGETMTLLDFLKYHQKRAWWTYILEVPFKLLSGSSPSYEVELDMRNLPSTERSIIRMFSEITKVEFDKKTGAAKLSLYMQDPAICAAVLDEIVIKYKEYMLEYRTLKAHQDVENLQMVYEQRKLEYYNAQQKYAMFMDSNRNIVLLSAQAEQLLLQQEMQLAYQVYSQIATQLEAARLKEQQSKPVFFIVEPVTVPYKPVGPGKTTLLIVFTFLSACFAFTWVIIGKSLWTMFRNNL